MHNKDGESRRNFMKKTAITAAAVVSGPQILARAASDPAKREGVMGAGEHLYEWVNGWGELPEGKNFGYTHAIREVADGRIFVHNQSPDSVAIFDPDGKFIKSWGPEYASGAHGMDIRTEEGVEYLYLALTGQHRLVKTTLDGEVVLEIGAPRPDQCAAYDKDDKFVPTNTAFGPNGDFYIADGYGQNYIHQYSIKGEYIRSWGGAGDEPGKMRCPHGIMLDTRGEKPELVVADRANVRLQYFSTEGEHLRFVNEGFLHPCHFDQRGDDLLVPDLYGRVTIIGKDNKVITHLGETPDANKVEKWPNLQPEQFKPGKFSSPHGASWDQAGNVYVAEWTEHGRITKLRRVS